jgi:hypothetical protein
MKDPSLQNDENLSHSDFLLRHVANATTLRQLRPDGKYGLEGSLEWAKSDHAEVEEQTINTKKGLRWGGTHLLAK